MLRPKEPQHFEMTEKEVSDLLEHLEEGELSDKERHQLREIVLAVLWMGKKLEDRELSIRKLQRLSLCANIV